MVTVSKNKGMWAFSLIVGYALLFIACILAPRLTGLLPGIMALGGGLLYKFADKEGLRGIGFNPSLFILSSGMFLISAISFFWAVFPEGALEKLIKITPVFLCGIPLLHLAAKFPSGRLPVLHKVFVFGLAAGLFTLFIEVVFQHPLYRLATLAAPDASVKFSRLNQGAVILSLLLWPALLGATALRGKRLPLVLFFICLAVVFLTNSQSAQIALLAGGLAAGLSAIFPSLVFYGLLAGTGVLISGAPWLYKWLFEFWPVEFIRVKPSALERLDVWYVFAKKIPENFFFGHGMEAARTVDMLSQKLPHFDGKGVLHPHSAVLQIWFETGLAGACVFYAMIVFILLKIRDLPRAPLKACATGCFVSAFCVSLFGYGLWQGWLIGLYFITASMLICCAPQPGASSAQA